MLSQTCHAGNSAFSLRSSSMAFSCPARIFAASRRLSPAAIISGVQFEWKGDPALFRHSGNGRGVEPTRPLERYMKKAFALVLWRLVVASSHTDGKGAPASALFPEPSSAAPLPVIVRGGGRCRGRRRVRRVIGSVANQPGQSLYRDRTAAATSTIARGDQGTSANRHAAPSRGLDRSRRNPGLFVRFSPHPTPRIQEIRPCLHQTANAV